MPFDFDTSPSTLRRLRYAIALLLPLVFASTEPLAQSSGSSAHQYWHVKDFVNKDGASVKCDGIQDDTSGIQSAINARAKDGGDLHFSGTCRFTGTLVIPVSTTTAIRLIGTDQRSAVLSCDGAIEVCLQWGAPSRDTAGTAGNVTYYGGIENLTLNASARAANSHATVLRMVEPHFVTLRNVLVQGSNKGGTCIELLGSIAQGLNAPAGPHAWRNKFYDVWADNCTSPLVMENADENDFYSSNFSLPKSIKAAAYSLSAVRIKYGHNNRFFGLLLMGDTDPAYRTAYVGFKLDRPTSGVNQNHQIYGLVAEGFGRGIWIDGATGGAAPQGVTIYGYHSSINETDFLNVAPLGSGDNPANQAFIDEPLAQFTYRTRPGSHAPVTSVGLAAGPNTPNVNQGDVYYFTGHSSGSSVATLSLGKEGQLVWIRADPHVKFVDAADLGGADLYLWGRASYAPVMNALEWLCFLRTTDRWVMCGPPLPQNAAQGKGYFGRGTTSDFDGGYRTNIDGYYFENLPRNGATKLNRLSGSTDDSTAWYATRPGSITAMHIHSNLPRTGGNLTAYIYKNDLQYGALSAVLDSRNPTFKASTTTQGSMVFAPGDKLECIVMTEAWSPSGANVRCSIEVTQ